MCVCVCVCMIVFVSVCMHLFILFPSQLSLTASGIKLIYSGKALNQYIQRRRAVSVFPAWQVQIRRQEVLQSSCQKGRGKCYSIAAK